jgi:hypothetical protein
MKEAEGRLREGERREGGRIIPYLQGKSPVITAALDGEQTGEAEWKLVNVMPVCIYICIHTYTCSRYYMC